MSRDFIISRLFTCPVCRADMYVSEDGKSAFCRGERRHCFDFSADGYLSMSGGGGDSKGAVRARREFLSKDYYLPVACAVCDTVSKHVCDAEVLIDAGCGEGYYTSMLSNSFEMTVGFDLSKFACAAAAKSATKAGRTGILYSTASVFSLPVKDESADAVVNIFAPCAENEYARVLKSGGYLFVVGAGKRHLMGLKRAIYDDTYENGERNDLPVNMKRIDTVSAACNITVNGVDDIAALFSMTPYYWRTSVADKERLAGIETLETEIEFEINVYKKD